MEETASDLLTTAEVAAYLRMKERTIYEMAARRQIPCTRATGKLLFPRRLIDRWLEAQTELPIRGVAPPPPIYAGSSDPLLEWALRESGCGLATLTCGSTQGLHHLADGAAMLAGSHLLDPQEEDGPERHPERDHGYNRAAIRRIVPAPDVVAIRWAEREQGLLVAPGNPLGLTGLADLAAKRPRLAQRPVGTGTRLLLDTLLTRAGIDPATLDTADAPAQSQTDLAQRIAEGAADCGLATVAAATGPGLTVVPLGVWERFDLVMRRRDYFEPPIQTLLAFARSPAFRHRAASLPGYRIDGLGTVTFNG